MGAGRRKTLLRTRTDDGQCAEAAQEIYDPTATHSDQLGGAALQSGRTGNAGQSETAIN